MEFIVIRYFFPHGMEDEAEESTMKYFPTFEKAIKYAERYAKGPRFSWYEICDENMNTIYMKNAEGIIDDYR